MADDPELERIKRKRLAQIRKRFAEKAEKEDESSKIDELQIEGISDDDALKSILVGRAEEVLAAVQTQYPQVATEFKRILASLVRNGKIKDPISGEQMMWFFRKLGLRVRLKTYIRFSESGELKTLSDKLKENR